MKGGQTVRTFKLGDKVLVRSGPRAPFAGRVEGINQAKSLLRVTREALNPKPEEGLFVLESLAVKFAEVEKVSEV
jgi:transcription antitermination factor NusG